MLSAYLIAFPLLLAGPAKPATPAFDDIMPLSRVRPGMKGYGLTVFRGVRIERFEVTVVAVMKNGSFVAPGHDMILVRMNGGPMTSRQANLIRGMSGSPVYIDGKCIGAFSQGEPSTKEPLGGVTPIEDMLEAWDPKLPERMEYTAQPARRQFGRMVTLDRPLRVGNRVIRRVAFDAPRDFSARGNDTLVLRPCTTMVTVSGFSPRFRKRLAEFLEPYGVEVVQAMGGGRPVSFSGASLQPGAAFSVMLLSGDLTSGATGTVTYRRGNRLLGFGHPFLGLGPLRAPLCAAYVHDIYPLNAGSYKITTPGPVLGSSLQDRPFSISGQTGLQPETIPITVAVDDRTMGRSKTYRMQAVQHPRLTGGLVTLAVGSAVADIHSSPDPVTAVVETEVEAEGLGLIRSRNRVYSAGLVDALVTQDIEELNQILTANPFQPHALQQVRVRVTIEPGRRTAVVDHVSVPSATYRPGEKVDVQVALKPYGRPMEYKSLTLTIPRDCPAGQLTLTVQGGAAAQPTTLGGLVFRPAPPAQPDRSPPASVRQMVDRFLARERGDEIAVVLALPTSAMTVDGTPLRNLPPVLDNAIRSKRVSTLKTDRDEVRETLQTDWVVSGRQTLTLTVVRPDQATRTTPSSPAGTAPAATGAGTQVPTTLPGRVLSDEMEMSSQTRRSAQPSSGPSAQRTGQTRPAQRTQQATLTTAPATAPQAADAGQVKPVARTARLWRHSSQQDWANADMDGVQVNSAQELCLTPKFQRLTALPQSVVWCLLPADDGGVYAGTGTEAVIYHVAKDGQHREVARFPEVSVHCLARLPDGALLAGTAPNGRTYRVAPPNAPTLYHQADEPYVLALWACDDGTVLVGTGGGQGSVYRVHQDGSAEVLATNVDQHVHGVCMVQGSVYVATAGRGQLVMLDDRGGRHVRLHTPGQSVTAVIPFADGTVLASTAPSPQVYRVGPHGSPESVLQVTGSGLQTLVNLDGKRFAAAGGSQAYLASLGGPNMAMNVPPTVEALALAQDRDGRFWLGTANNGAIYVAEPLRSGSEGTLTSPVLDAGTSATWGRLTLTAWTPDGAVCRVQTRAGDSADPDGLWDDWLDVSLSAGDESIRSRPARYLQYRIVLTASPTGASPVVRSVTISYLPENRAPSVTLESPAWGEHWSGKQTVRWQATDPDQDPMSYEVEISRDQGRTWEVIPATALAGSTTETTSANPPASSQQSPSGTGVVRAPLTLEQVTAELDRHPDLPRAMREEILERTRKLVDERAGARIASPGTPAKPTRQTSQTLDTTKLPDGTYWLRVSASDAPANGPQARKAFSPPREVVLCNTPPVVVVLRSSRQIREDKSVVLEVVALQTLGYVSAAQWRLDGGEWTAAAPADGIADSKLERFVIATGAVAKGKHKLDVQVFNSAGLNTTDTIEIEIP